MALEFKLHPKENLFREGDKYNGMYIIKSGEICIFQTHQGMKITLATLKAGEVLGTLTLFSKSPRSATAQAVVESVLVHVPAEAIEKSFSKELPIWAQAAIKDAIARVHDMNAQLVKAKVLEKENEKRMETPFALAARLLGFLAFLVKIQTVDDDGVLVFPCAHFLTYCEAIFGKPYNELAFYFEAFKKSSLIQVVENKKYGPVLLKPNGSIITECQNFLKENEKGKHLLPIKAHNLLSGLVRLYKSAPQTQVYNGEALLEGLKKYVAGVPPSAQSLTALVTLGILIKNNGEYQFRAGDIQKRLIFESCWRLIDDGFKN